MNSLYTFIMEFRGGTYVSQVHAPSLEKSVLSWTQKLREEKDEIEFLGDTTIKEIEKELLSSDSHEKPVPLSGLKNVWCITISTNEGLGLVNVVKTME